ncbi:serine/arginine-rich splicing factor 6 [Biomphalaria glabrata]|nr:serine/arginine-rich splicing factor 6 [Biomphalaria glabrata]
MNPTIKSQIRTNVKGDSHFYNLDGIKTDSAPLSKYLKYTLSQDIGKRRSRWKKSYSPLCMCLVGCILVVCACTALILYNVVAYQGLQERIEETLTATLKQSISDELKEKIHRQLEFSIHKMEKKLSHSLEKKLQSLLELNELNRKEQLRGRLPDKNTTTSDQPDNSMSDQPDYSLSDQPDYSLSENLVNKRTEFEEKRLKELEENLEFRLEKSLTKHLEGKLSKMIEEKNKEHRNNSRLHKSAHNTMNETAEECEHERHVTYVHLQGRSPRRIIGSGPDKNFIWDRIPAYNCTGFEYIIDPNTNSVSKVKILKTGVYLVYSQIAVHGNKNRKKTFPLDCAHETVQTNIDDEKKVILKSMLTQHNLGRPIIKIEKKNLHPIDTKFQMGIFHLSQNDTLSVRYSENCANFNYLMQPEYSYFGVLMLSEESNA